MLASTWNFLRDLPTRFFGASRPPPVEKQLMLEKIRGGLRAHGNRIRFLPLVDSVVEETDEMRLAYRQMLREPSVKAAFLGKALAVACLDININAASDSDRDKEIAEWVKYGLEKTRGGIRRITQGILFGGLIDGFSVCEKVNRYVDRGKWKGKVGFKATKAKDTRYVQLMGDQFRNVTAVYDTRTATAYHPGNFLIWQHLPIFESPLGMSDFRAAYRPYWIMDTAWKLRAIGLERYTLPMLKGTYTSGDTDLQASLEEAIAHAQSEYWFTLPQGAEITAVELATRSQSDFDAAIEDLQKEVFLAISGAFLQALEGGVTGAAGNSMVHRSTAELLPWMLAAEVADVLNDQAIPDLVDLNYTDADYPTVTLGAVNVAELQAELVVDEGLQRLGLPLSKKELYKRYNRGVPTDPEDELKPPATPAPGMFVEPAQEVPAIATIQDDQPVGQADTLIAGTPTDAERVEVLLAKVKTHGFWVLSDVARSAAMRMVDGGKPELTKEERQRLTDSIASTIAPADLLGRYRVRERLRRAQGKAPVATGRGAKKFSEEADTPFRAFAEPVTPLAPEAAVDYFKKLEPTLGVDPAKFLEETGRRAFSLAGVTEVSLLEKLQSLIADRLQTGENFKGAPGEIEALLTDAGVTTANPQHSDMVFRTNALSAYAEGATEELQHPDVIDEFPIWKYSGIRDGRQGEDHAVHFDKYFPSKVRFPDVRGERVFNCRCNFIPVWKGDVQGLKVETSW